jgi:manganese transport protein
LVPLVQFTNDKRKMGEFASSWWVGAFAWITADGIIALNALLVFLILRGAA